MKQKNTNLALMMEILLYILFREFKHLMKSNHKESLQEVKSKLA